MSNSLAVILLQQNTPRDIAKLLEIENQLSDDGKRLLRRMESYNAYNVAVKYIAEQIQNSIEQGWFDTDDQ